MSAITVTIPDSINDRLHKLAKQQQITVDQFVASALAEKLAAVDAEGYIAGRAGRADETKFRDALAAVPDVPPEPHDAL